MTKQDDDADDMFSESDSPHANLHVELYDPDNQGIKPLPNAPRVSVLERMIKSISEGVAPRVACQTCGVAYRDYRRWRRLGSQVLDAVSQDEKPPVDSASLCEAYALFFLATERAEGAFEEVLDRELVSRVDGMTDKDLMRLRELRAANWNPRLSATRNDDLSADSIDTPAQGVMGSGGQRITIGSGAQVFMFTPETLRAADAALLDAGIIDAEVIDDGKKE